MMNYLDVGVAVLEHAQPLRCYTAHGYTAGVIERSYPEKTMRALVPAAQAFIRFADRLGARIIDFRSLLGEFSTSVLDHPVAFRKKGKPDLFMCEPYNDGERAREYLRKLGWKVFPDTIPYGCWNPPHTTAVIATKAVGDLLPVAKLLADPELREVFWSPK